MTSPSILLECRNVHQQFSDGDLCVDVLSGVNLQVRKSESVAIIGASGSGKSTLLHILGGLSMPTSGTVLFKDHDLSTMSDKARGVIRNYGLGFVYQFHHLLPEFTAQENAAMPLLIRRTSRKEAFSRASEILDRVGLGNRLRHKPGELSGGERQRTAIARALITEPDCILADEPTGNLDRDAANRVFELMNEMSVESGTSLLMVTHDQQLASRVDRIFRIENGQLVAPN